MYFLYQKTKYSEIEPKNFSKINKFETIGILNSLRNNRKLNPFDFNLIKSGTKHKCLNEEAGNEMQIELQSMIGNLADQKESFNQTILYADKLKKKYLQNHLIN